jgi:hypothetical protein
MMQLMFSASKAHSAQNELINIAPAKFAEHRNELQNNHWLVADPTGKVLLCIESEIRNNPPEPIRAADQTDSRAEGAH